MKRTKQWWATLDSNERSKLVQLERAERQSSGYGAGGMIPDDCCECGFCNTPHLGTGLCQLCLRELLALINKADRAVKELE